MAIREFILDGKKRKGLITSSIRKRRRSRRIRGKDYEWEEHYLIAYIPSDLLAEKYAVIPLDEKREEED